MSAVHITAVEKAISDAGTSIPAAYGPLVELVRALARQMDVSGAEGPSARLSAAYLSALKDFGRVAVAARADKDKPVDILGDFLATHLHPVPRTDRLAS